MMDKNASTSASTRFTFNFTPQNYKIILSMTVKAILYRARARKNGQQPLYMRITKQHRCRYMTTGKWLLPKQFDAATGTVLKNHPGYRQLNLLIRNKIAEIESAETMLEARKNGVATLREIK